MSNGQTDQVRDLQQAKRAEGVAALISLDIRAAPAEATTGRGLRGADAVRTPMNPLDIPILVRDTSSTPVLN